MASYLSGVLQSAYHYWEVGTFDPFVLKATPENLQKALQARTDDVLKYTFQMQFIYSSTIFSILEYAICLGDKTAVTTLATLHADFNHSKRSEGNLLHFYINLLEESKAPDLEMLDLILKHVEDPNAKEKNRYRTPLEHLLEHMKYYKKMHWGVVERLLQVCKITGAHGVTAFTVLRDSQNEKLHLGYRSEQEEECFLENLCKYAALERKYHPTSNSYLTLEQFKSQTYHFKSAVTKAATCIRTDHFKIRFKITPAEVISLNKTKAQVIWQKLYAYHQTFQLLVKEAKFKEFFRSRELVYIISAVNKVGDYDGTCYIASHQFDLLGLSDQKKN